MNGQHLSLMSAAELAPLVTPALVAAGLTTEDELGQRSAWYAELLELLKTRARTTHDIVRQAFPYFSDDISFEPEAVAKAWKDTRDVADVLAATRERLAGLEGWNTQEMERALRELAEERGIAGGKVFQPLRVALTGMSVSPGIFEVLLVMGRERAFRHIELALDHLKGSARAS